MDRATPAPGLLSAFALRYAGAGWRVLPIVPGGKRPLYPGWQHDATTSPDLVSRWWPAGTTRNLGVLAGEAFDAWDIEAAHLPLLRAHLERGGHRLPETPVARTGRGGVHILTEPTGVGGSRDLYLGGVHVGELKSSGGFIVAAPSATEAPYAWLRMPADMSVAPCPEFLLDLLARPQPAAPPPTRRQGPGDPARALDALAVAVRDAREGRRNAILYWAARRALEEGIPAPVAATVLSRAALAAGLGRREVDATVRSALASGGAR